MPKMPMRGAAAALLLFLLLGAGSAFSLSPSALSHSALRRSCSKAPKPARTPAAIRLTTSVDGSLSQKDIASLLSDGKYAMDTSSIAQGSGRETYIGEGTGVNDGTGIGPLQSWVRGLAGRYLSWKNRPVYNRLWTIIEDDLLKMVRDRVTDLHPARTCFADKGAEPAPYAFATADGKCTGSVEALKGGRVDWITTCRFFSETLGFGNMRIDGWVDRSTRAPHVAVHLCIVFNVLFIYVSLVPRTNLVLDDAYNDHVYGRGLEVLNGKSLNDLYVECVEDKAFRPYESKYHEVNAFMVSPTTLLYTVPFSEKNFQKVRDLSVQHMQAWLDLMEEEAGVLVDGIATKERQAELLRLDVRTRQFCGRDPDTKNVAKILGLDMMDKLVRTLYGDPDDPVWARR